MKTLIIAVAVTIGGIQLGLSAFDAAKETAQQSQTAELIKARQNI